MSDAAIIYSIIGGWLLLAFLFVVIEIFLGRMAHEDH